MSIISLRAVLLPPINLSTTRASTGCLLENELGTHLTRDYKEFIQGLWGRRI